MNSSARLNTHAPGVYTRLQHDRPADVYSPKAYKQLKCKHGGTPLAKPSGQSVVRLAALSLLRATSRCRRCSTSLADASARSVAALLPSCLRSQTRIRGCALYPSAPYGSVLYVLSTWGTPLLSPWYHESSLVKVVVAKPPPPSSTSFRPLRSLLRRSLGDSAPCRSLRSLSCFWVDTQHSCC
jgi:hypothetical protein